MIWLNTNWLNAYYSTTQLFLKNLKPKVSQVHTAHENGYREFFLEQ